MSVVIGGAASTVRTVKGRGGRCLGSIGGGVVTLREAGVREKRLRVSVPSELLLQARNVSFSTSEQKLNQWFRTNTS